MHHHIQQDLFFIYVYVCSQKTALELQNGCWELHLGPLEKQQSFLPAEPSLQLPKRGLIPSDQGLLGRSIPRYENLLLDSLPTLIPARGNLSLCGDVEEKGKERWRSKEGLKERLDFPVSLRVYCHQAESCRWGRGTCVTECPGSPCPPSLSPRDGDSKLCRGRSTAQAAGQRDKGDKPREALGTRRVRAARRGHVRAPGRGHQADVPGPVAYAGRGRRPSASRSSCTGARPSHLRASWAGPGRGRAVSAHPSRAPGAPAEPSSEAPTAGSAARRGAAQTMGAALARAAELRAWRGPEAAP